MEIGNQLLVLHHNRVIRVCVADFINEAVNLHLAIIKYFIKLTLFVNIGKAISMGYRTCCTAQSY